MVTREALITKFGTERVLQELEDGSLLILSQDSAMVTVQDKKTVKLMFDGTLSIAVDDVFDEYQITELDDKGYNSETNIFTYAIKAKKLELLNV